jgi:LacI family transcriptional regulator
VSLIKKYGMPIVVIDRRLPTLQTDVVRCDSEGGAYKLTRLLLSLGHRNIAILDGPCGVSTADDRLNGYCRALSEAGIRQINENEYHGGFTQKSGYEMALQVLKRTNRPTAVFAANNFIGIGALKAFQEMSVRVPEDIALVGFDDLPPALVTFPFLTVATQPAYEMGTKAIEILLNRLNGDSPDQYQEVVLPADIVIRKSSGVAIV